MVSHNGIQYRLLHYDSGFHAHPLSIRMIVVWESEIGAGGTVFFDYGQWDRALEEVRHFMNAIKAKSWTVYRTTFTSVPV